MLDPKGLENAVLLVLARARADDWLPCTIGDLRNRMAAVDPDAANTDTSGLIGAIAALASEQLLLVRKRVPDSPGPLPFDLLRQHDETYLSDFFFRGSFELKLAHRGKSRAFESAAQSPLEVGAVGEGSSAASAPKTGKIAPPSVAVAFGAAKIPLGGTSSLTFILNNSNLKDRLSGIGFTDNLPAGLVVAASPGVVNSCGGTVTAVAGSNSVSLSGASLGPLTSGTLVVHVAGVRAGVKVNSVQITSTEGGSGNTASASVVVVAPPVITKAFDPQVIAIGQTSRLAFKINNPNAVSNVTGVAFTDLLPPGLMISDPNGLVGSWADGTIVASAKGRSITLSGAALPPNGSCAFQLLVTGVSEGSKNNTTGQVTSLEGGTGYSASASIVVGRATEVSRSPQVEASGDGPANVGTSGSAQPGTISELGNTITQVTRREIVDYLSLSEGWSGRLSEVEFLARLYDLTKIPSTDRRFDTAREDILQHRVTNPGDWSPDWVFTDSRFNLLHGPDRELLRFLCETVHPVVRPDSDTARRMVTEFNAYLGADGWEIVAEKQISGKPLFSARRLADGPMQPLQQQPQATRANAAKIAQEVGSSSGLPSTSTFGYSPRCSRILVAAAGYTRNARNSEGYTLRANAILYALFDAAWESGLEVDDAVYVLGEAAKEIGIQRYQVERRRYLKDNLRSDFPLREFDGEQLQPALEYLSPSSLALLEGAKEIAGRTGVGHPFKSILIDTRHLIAASVTTLPDHLGTLPYVYSALGVDTGSLRSKLFSFLVERYSSRDFLHKWAEVLTVSPSEVLRLTATASDLPDVLKEPIVASEEAQLAGYISDAVPDESQQLGDELGIDEDVRTLCSVLLAREVSPPLAVGLFGDWGTGKSYFMEKMYREIELLAQRAGAVDKTAYFSKVVQIRFNAWHYADSNLWASLVSHIFDDLSRKVCPSEPPEVTKKKLLLQLDSAKQVIVDAEAQQVRAEQERASAEEALRVAREQREGKQIALARVRMPELWDVFTDGEHQQLKADLTGLLDGLGLPSVLNTIGELNETYQQAFTLGGRLQAAILSLWRSTSRTTIIILLAIGFLLVPLVGWLVERLLHAQGIAAVTALIGDITLAVGGFATALKKNLSTVSSFLEELRSKRDQVLKVIEKKRQEVSAEEMVLQQQLEKLRGKEDLAQQRVAAANMKVKEIEGKIEELESGRSLSKFLVERVQTDDYRKHLGIMSLIRRDFARLNDLLTQGKEGLEKVNRIILYVDDLDRCPATMVVDVLQAIHLLLAMPLFIAVVGVDLRWLLHSLDERYTAFQKSEKADAGRKEWTTSPQNYLEKIFQIPFTLSPMKADGYKKLVSSLMPTARVPEEEIRVTEMSSSDDGGQASPGSAPQLGSGEAADPQTISSQPAESQIGGQLTVSESKSHDRDLNPEALVITEQEQRFAAELFAFMPTPRSTKRFTNIYRILKAPLTGRDLQRFQGTKESPGEFQATMLLLSITIGLPQQAQRLFPLVSALAESRTPWREVFSKYLTLNKAQAALLNEVKLGDDLTPFVTWSPRVARFTFEAAKSVRTEAPPANASAAGSA